MTEPGTEPAGTRRPFSRWREHRARWSLPLVIIAVIGAVAVIDHLDSQQISQVDQPQTPNLVAVQGGTAHLTLDQPWSGFNPNTPAGAASSTPTLLDPVLPSAYVFNEKLVAEVNPDLLTSVEVRSTAPLVIQYQLNPKAVWSDGVPVSADDFIYAWQTQRGEPTAPANANAGAGTAAGAGAGTGGGAGSGAGATQAAADVASTIGYRDISSVVGSNRGTLVTVTFTTPFTDWRILFDHLVPAHVAERIGWNGFTTFNPADDLSAGPYRLVSVTGSSAVLVRNPRWWGPRGVLQRIDVSVAPGSATAAVGTRGVGQAQAFGLDTLSAVSAQPGLQSETKPGQSFLQLEFNTKAPVTAKTAVREAVAHLVDRPDLLKKTFGTIEPSLTLNESHLAVPTQPNYTASSAAGDYDHPDVATATQLLTRAGYHQNGGGAWVDSAGAPLTLRLAVQTGSPWIGGVATDLVAGLRDHGIAVTVTAAPGVAGMEAAAAANSYDMALVTRTASPFMTVTVDWYSYDNRPVGAQQVQNWSRFDDPQVDQLFDQAAQALNPVTGGAIYSQIDDQLWDQMVALPLFAVPTLVTNGVQIQNVEFNPTSDGILWNAAQWTLLKPAPKASSH